MKVDLGNGMRDGLNTAGTRLRMRMLKDRGAQDIKLTQTGRLTFTLDGERCVYTVKPPRDYAEARLFEAAGTTDSPLCRALTDTSSRPVSDSVTGVEAFVRDFFGVEVQ